MRDSLAELHSDAFGWAMTCCRRDRALAEEVLQMAYVRILEGSARFDEKSSRKTWLFGVIRRIAAGERRRAWRSAVRLARFASLRPEPAGDPLPETDMSARHEAARLVQALERLSSRQREILHLVFYQELSIEEAAGVLGMRPGTARVHYERGKQRLRRLLRNEDRP